MGSCGQAEFSLGNSFPGTQCPQTQDCLPALLITHPFWLSSLLPVGSVWFGVGDSYLQSREIRVFMFQRTCSVGVWPRWGPEHPEWVTCPHPCHLQLLGHPYWVNAVVLSPPLAPGNKLIAARNKGGMSVEAGVSSAAPASLGPTASKYWRQFRVTRCNPSWTYRPHDL